MDIFSFGVVLVQILLIDLVLAGDNAIIIGLAVARLNPEQRKTAIFVGIAGATVLRVIFALVALELLAIIGLTLAGGVLLLWVVWKSARELMTKQHEQSEEGVEAAPASLSSAIWKIIIADISMSLDNVLAVAGAAHDHPVLLAIGLVFSVALMGVAASFVARLMGRYPWIVWIGLVIVLYVALEMIWKGWHQVAPHLSGILG